MYESKYLFNTDKKINNEIVIIDIDDKSLWLLDRPDYLADVVKAVSSLGKAEVIGIDILFDEAKHPDPPENNRKNMGLNCPYDPKKHLDEMKLACVMNEESVSNVILAIDYDTNKHKLIYPLNCLKEAAFGLGVVVIPHDNDDINRKVLLLIDNDKEEGLLYSLPLAVATYVKAKPPQIIDNNTIIFGDNKIKSISSKYKFFGATPQTFQLIPQMLGPNKRFKYISAEEVRQNVTNKKYLTDKFKGKIVLIGSSHFILKDIKLTPFSKFNRNDSFNGLMPGVEYNANAINSLLHNKFYYQAPLWLDFVWVTVFILISLIIMLHTRILYSVILGLSLIVVSVLIGYSVFLNFSLILSIGTSALIMILAIPVTSIYRYLKEKKEKEVAELERSQLMSLFDRYVSPDVANLIWKNKHLISLTGDKNIVTVLFSDIRDFTTLSEKTDPEELLRLLNEYFERMSKVIYENNGNLNKFIGDGLMVLYGAPLSSDDPSVDAINAVNSAISMIKEVKELNDKWKTEFNGVNINIGVGIHTGEVIVGNIGSSKRLEYSAIGDTVNLSSRLEGVNKEYKTNIIISEDTYYLVKDSFEMTCLGKVKVKGRTEEVNIYTLVNL